MTSELRRAEGYIPIKKDLSDCLRKTMLVSDAERWTRGTEHTKATDYTGKH